MGQDGCEGGVLSVAVQRCRAISRTLLTPVILVLQMMRGDVAI